MASATDTRLILIRDYRVDQKMAEMLIRKHSTLINQMGSSELAAKNITMMEKIKTRSQN